VRLLGLLFLFSLVPSAGPAVLVVHDGDSAPYRKAVDGVKQATASVEQVASDDPALAARLARDDGALVVALGPKAAAAVARSGRTSASAALLRAEDAPAGMSAVSFDVAPGIVAPWIKRAFPGRTRVIVLVRPDDTMRKDALRAAAAASGFRVELVDVADPRDAVAALVRALAVEARTSVVWLQPDPKLATRDTLPALVEAGLRARVPTVGFSAYLLRAGALAAVRLDFAAMGEEAARRAAGKPARPPDAWATLEVNGRLAERLGVTVGAGAGVEVNR